jgi:hypothetical protein
MRHVIMNKHMDKDWHYPVPGYQWVQFVGGDLDGQWQIMREPVEDGNTYNKMVPRDETWVYSYFEGKFFLRLP